MKVSLTFAAVTEKPTAKQHLHMPSNEEPLVRLDNPCVLKIPVMSSEETHKLNSQFTHAKYFIPYSLSAPSSQHFSYQLLL